MKIEIPLTFDDITIDQIQAHGEQELGPIDLVEAYSTTTRNELLQFPKTAIDKAAAHLSKILDSPTQKHFKQFKLDGVEYGFIPDWGALTGGEYIDLSAYIDNPIENAHKILCILYRPIIKGAGDFWDIEPYTGTKRAEAFRKAPAGLYFGAIAFFLTTRRDSVLNSLKSLQDQLTKTLTPSRKRFKTSSLRSGLGITSSSKRQEAT